MKEYLKEAVFNISILFVKGLFVLGRVVEVLLIGAALFAWLFYIGGFPTYRTAIISFEHWPVAFLGGIVIMVLLGFVLRKAQKKYCKAAAALYGGAGVCAMMLGKAIIDDMGDALVLYEDIHTSPIISGWTALIVVTVVVSIYYCWLFTKARKISRLRR